MKKDAVVRGSGNVFADVGLPDAEGHLAKAKAVILIGETIKRRGLNQSAAARMMGISQPDVSKLLKGRFEGFSLERLLDMHLALGNDVKVTVTDPANENRQRGHLKLAFA